MSGGKDKKTLSKAGGYPMVAKGELHLTGMFRLKKQRNTFLIIRILKKSGIKINRAYR